MPLSVRAHLATQPDSVSLENWSMLADCAVAAEKDVDEAKPGVAEINVSESVKLVELLEDLSGRLKQLETATAKATKKKTYGHSQPTENHAPRHSSFRMFKQNFLCSTIRLLLGKMYQIITKKIVVLTHRRRKRRKVTLLNRSTQPTHCLFSSPNIRWQSTHVQRT